MREDGGELSKIPLKGWNRTEERRHKDFKRGGGASGVKGWVPKKRGGGGGGPKKGGGLEPPYELWLGKLIFVGNKTKR